MARQRRLTLTAFERRCFEAERVYLRRFPGSSDDATLSRMKWVAEQVKTKDWRQVQRALQRCERVAARRTLVGLPGLLDDAQGL